ncbi:MAG: hypothetical protein QCH35_09805 [Methanomicrobiaceae archaeon]|nr:hypothetical protein [Methanomicrobiaceae archaeon]
MGNEPDLARLRNVVTTLDRYVRVEDFSGYDPYDALNSPILSRLPGVYPKILMTQLFVYSPVNLRGLFSVKPGRNPKALGLFLSAYCSLFKGGFVAQDAFDAIAASIVGHLHAGRAEGYSHYCWGFNFPWQDVTRFSDTNLPTIVNTAYVGNSLLDLYDVTRDASCLHIAESCCEFILHDLNRTEMENGVCFSYTPIDHHVVHNANMLGAAFLARVYAYIKDSKMREYAEMAFDYSVSEQKEDGSWAYSKNPAVGTERMQIDFHQGFILDSICDFLRYGGRDDADLHDVLLRGVKFYKTAQFHENGRSKWRLPRAWPVDIHHQAQGILTFANVHDVIGIPGYLDFAARIADYTISEMFNPRGYFNYQKWFWFSNTIPYVRWAQAWMMRALATMLEVHKRG